MSYRVAAAASGSGTNFQAILNAIESGLINAKPVGLIVSRENTGAEEKAQKADIPVVQLRKPPHFEEDFLKAVKSWKPDLLLLAGFLKQVPESVIRELPNRILNIHPSLLPEFGGKGFYGRRVHEAVIDAGRSVSGCTVHLVNEAYDEGRILAQRRVHVLPDDTPETLASRILTEEHALYPEVIQDYLNTLKQISNQN